MKGNKAASRYTGDGRRRSSMAHANHVYHMDCGRVIAGNGWRMHQQAHGCRLLTYDQWRHLMADRDIEHAMECGR